MKFENLKDAIYYLLKCRFCNADTEIDGVRIRNDKLIIDRREFYLDEFKIVINIKTNKCIINSLQKEINLHRNKCQNCKSTSSIIINEKLESEIYLEYYSFEFKDKYYHFFFNTHLNELILEIHGKDYSFKSFNYPIINFDFENKSEVINKLNLINVFQ